MGVNSTSEGQTTVDDEERTTDEDAKAGLRHRRRTAWTSVSRGAGFGWSDGDQSGTAALLRWSPGDEASRDAA